MFTKQKKLEEHYNELSRKTKVLESLSKKPYASPHVNRHVEEVRRKILEIQNIPLDSLSEIFVHKSQMISAWSVIHRARRKQIK